MEKKSSKSTLAALAALGVLALFPVVCCGGPVIFTILGATSISAILGTIANIWVSMGILFILIVGGAAIAILRFRSRQADCCGSFGMNIEHHGCSYDGRGE
ncbi:hypothetical protein [Bacillus smithii]|uniref:hypothetical protein n=1 Tax=Bacillus smithii TaxID=1479 RepID=UPI0030C95778